MAKAGLRTYLEKIKEGRPINPTAFKKCLPENIASNLRTYFDIEITTSTLCILTPIRPDIFDDLMRYSAPTTNRSEASFAGNSHYESTSITYLLMFTGFGSPLVPSVCVIGDEGEISSPSRQSRLLLIENEENFSEYQKMLSLASQWLGCHISLENTDVMLGAGNRVNKKCVANWISESYDTVLCMFDYDLGGLQIMETLRKTIPDSIFVEPPDWSRYESCFLMAPREVDDFRKALVKADGLNLMGLKSAFLNTLKFMEQETLLIEEYEE